MPIYHTIKLKSGSAQVIDLNEVVRVDGGSFTRNGPLPDTTITMVSGTVYVAEFLCLGNIVNAMRAHGLI